MDKTAKVASGLVEYIDAKGRVSMSELITDVQPRTHLTENGFISLLGDLCDQHKIMVACVDQGGPRYQIFTHAFTPVQVDHSRYLTY